MTVVNYASSGINKLRASLNDEARVVIYDRHMFIEQATDSVVCIIQWYYTLLYLPLFQKVIETHEGEFKRIL